MTPLEIAIWAIGAIGLCAVAWAFFKSDSLVVRLGTLGVFGAFYIWVLAQGWGGVEWFNATTIGVVVIALLSRMKTPLPPKQTPAADPSAPVPTSAEVDSEADDPQPTADSSRDAEASDRAE